jgi:3-hydroxy-9,10-secoandrosta-1,3,5(10)-triene-9,17-dione monooxygenase
MSTPAQVRSLTATPLPKSRAEAVERARALLPKIRARARRVDSDRIVPQETIRELTEAGLFGVVMPKVLGGADLGFATLVDVTVEIASACGSSGWVYGVLAGHSWMINLFPIEAQREIYAGAGALIATVFRLSGDVRPVPGGYRLTGGEGRFCSGIDHADWVIVGNQVLRDGAEPEPRFFVVPKSDITEIVDDWYVAGMRGTGSKTIKIADAFIPELHSVSVAEMNSGKSPGALFHAKPVYQMSWRGIAPFSLVGVPMGLGRAAVASFSESLRNTMAKFNAEQVAEQSATFARLAVAAADIDAVHASVIESARRLDEARDAADITAEQLSRAPRDWAYAAQRSRNAVSSLFEAAGGSATYDASELQRLWRDANASAQHIAFTWDNAMTAYGRALVGVAPPKFGPKGR